MIPYLKFTGNKDFTASCTFTDLEYSLDGSTWSAIVSGTKYTTTDKVFYLRGTNTSTLHYNILSVDGDSELKIKAEGDIWSLNYIDGTHATTSAYLNQFFTGATWLSEVDLKYDEGNTGLKLNSSSMFSSCTSLTDVSLDLTSISSVNNYGSQSMFGECSSLVSVNINLSNVTSIGNYGFQSAFSDCPLLTTANIDLSSLTTIGNYGCYGMFNGCSSLVTANIKLDSLTSLGDASTNTNVCASMFSGCSSLTTTPNLKSVTTIGKSGCSSMFRNCTSLTAIDFSHITSIANYGCYNMFNGCSSLPVYNKGEDKDKLFTCPADLGTDAVKNMFTGTKGPYTDNPIAGGNYYYYYEKPKPKLEIYSNVDHKTNDIKNLKVQDKNTSIVGLRLSKTSLSTTDKDIIVRYLGNDTDELIFGVSYKLKDKIEPISDMQFKSDTHNSTIEVGGLETKSVLKNKSVLDTLDKILHKDTISINVSKITLSYTKGTTVTTVPCTITIKSTIKDLVNYKIYFDGSLLTTKEITGKSYTEDLTITLAESRTADFKLKFEAINETDKTDSEEFNITFYNATGYYGTDSSLTEVTIDGKEVSLTFNSTEFIKPIFKYPSHYGDIKQITSSDGGDDYTTSFAKTTETIDGETYNVYTKIVESVHDNFTYKFSW